MPISVPERLLLGSNAVSRSRMELSDELGRDPTEDEIADHSGIPVPRQRQIRVASGGTNEGTVTITANGWSQTYGDAIPTLTYSCSGNATVCGFFRHLRAKPLDDCLRGVPVILGHNDGEMCR